MQYVKMTRYSIETRDLIFVKGYWILSFSKRMGNYLRGKCNQKHFDYAEQSATDALKTISKRLIQKTSKATGDLIGNRIADKFQRSQKLHHRILRDSSKWNRKYRVWCQDTKRKI